MTLHITDHRAGFGPGKTAVTTFDEDDSTGIALSVWRLEEGDSATETAAHETAWLLMAGELEVIVGDEDHTMYRGSLFDQGPSAVHVSRGEQVTFKAVGEVELTVYEVDNDKAFKPRVFTPADVEDEPRGKGQVGDACFRYVRTIFDGTNSPDEAKLVLGEVVTFPGRWSSYPPHHHAQPEIYHYRFTEPQGYGHAELGDDVRKVKHNDAVKIFPPNTHAQCAAPGYGMYYSWVIRHLDDDRYTVPTFEPEHDWTRSDGVDFWLPSVLRDEDA